MLPKSNVPQTLVVISLDPPIRKGQTYYPHILCQFNNDEELNVELDITEEQLEAKNEKVGCCMLSIPTNIHVKLCMHDLLLQA